MYQQLMRGKDQLHNTSWLDLVKRDGRITVSETLAISCCRIKSLNLKGSPDKSSYASELYRDELDSVSYKTALDFLLSVLGSESLPVSNREHPLYSMLIESPPLQGSSPREISSRTTTSLNAQTVELLKESGRNKASKRISTKSQEYKAGSVSERHIAGQAPSVAHPRELQQQDIARPSRPFSDSATEIPRASIISLEDTTMEMF